MKQAVGTSLLIIAAKSLIGFTGDPGNETMDGYRYYYNRVVFSRPGGRTLNMIYECD